jgi:ADP-ribose pyrophosphatase
VTLAPWKKVSSRILLDLSPWFSVIGDTVILPSGRTADNYYRIEAPDSVLIHAVLPNGQVLMERHYKQCLGRVILTSPAGSVEAGEMPLEAARRELLEETGYEADLWQSMGAFKIDGTRGVCTAHLFRAEALRYVAAPNTGDMEELEVVFMDLEQIAQSVRSGEIALLPDLAIIGLARSGLFRDLFAKAEPAGRSFRSVGARRPVR